jgi:ABC-type nitrate/sulfonate/bicarbonate transport system permease component
MKAQSMTPQSGLTLATPDEEPRLKREIPKWAITCLSIALVLLTWEFFGRDINPVFGSYPSAIAVAFWDLLKSGQLLAALAQSMQAFVVGYALAVVVGVPLGLLIGRSRILEAAIGVFITGAYAMPLVALVPLLVL